MKIKLDDDILLYMIPKILGVYLIIVLIPHLDTSQLSYATHVSEPIISIDPNAQYEKNETVSVNGWVKYNDQPASNVLILLTLTNPNSDEIFQDEIRSDLNGNFTSSIDLSALNLTDIGAYRITAESQCRDEHRSICNHNTTSDVFMVTN